MANAIYGIYKQALLTAVDTNLDLDQTTANISPYAVLLSATYVLGANINVHDFFNDLSGVVGAANGIQITAPTISTAGTFDGNDVTFTAVSGSQVTQFVIYRQNAGANTTWHLVAYFDTATGLPVTPNGGDITITWNASGIFTL